MVLKNFFSKNCFNMLRLDCWKKKKIAYTHVTSKSLWSACKRSTHPLFLKTVRGSWWQNSASVLQQHRGPEAATREEEQRPTAPAGAGAWPGPHLCDGPRGARPRTPGLPACRAHRPDAAQRDFTPTRTTRRTIMMTNNIRITSIFRFFF